MSFLSRSALQVIAAVEEVSAAMSGMPFASKHAKLSQAVADLGVQPGTHCELWAKLAQCAISCGFNSLAIDCAKRTLQRLPEPSAICKIATASEVPGASRHASWALFDRNTAHAQ